MLVCCPVRAPAGTAHQQLPHPSNWYPHMLAKQVDFINLLIPVDDIKANHTPFQTFPSPRLALGLQQLNWLID